MDLKEIRIHAAVFTYKPGKEFPVLLKRLYLQERRPDRLLVVNTEEKYWDRSLEKLYPGMELIHIRKEEFDHGASRRMAADYLSDGDVLVFMTQDAVPADRHLVSSLAQVLLDEATAGAVYARQIPRKSCSYLEKCTREYNYPEKSRIRYIEDTGKYGIKAFFCSDVCAAYWRESYEYAGGFPAKAIFNEDMVMASSLMRMGYGVVYCADARVIHSHNYSPLQQFHRNFDIGVSHVEFPEVFASVPAEGEGIRLVKRTARKAIRDGKAYLLGELLIQSAAKYTGYLLGRHFQRLPREVVLRLTMNKGYWKNIVFSDPS